MEVAPGTTSTTQKSIRVILYDQFYRTRIHPTDKEQNQSLKDDLQKGLEAIHSDPFLLEDPITVEEAELDEDGRACFDFFTTELFRPLLNELIKSKWQLVFSDNCAASLFFMPDRTLSRWGEQLCLAEGVPTDYSYLQLQSDVHLNYVLRKAVEDSRGRAIFHSALLPSKKSLAFLNLMAFRKGKSKITPIMIICQNGSLSRWAETVRHWMPKASMSYLGPNAERKGRKDLSDVLLVAEQSISKIPTWETNLPPGVRLSFVILDEVCDERAKIRQLAQVVRSPERISIIQEDYSKLEVGLKKLIFGHFIRPDLADGEGQCGAYPPLQAGHLVGPENQLLFNPQAAFSMQIGVKILEGEISEEIQKIKTAIESKEVPTIDKIHSELFPGKAAILRSQLENKYTSVNHYDAPKTHGIKDLEGYLDRHVQDSQRQALRLHLCQQLEIQKALAVVQELSCGELAQQQNVVILYRNLSSAQQMKEKILANHKDWKVIGPAEGRAENLRDEYNTCMSGEKPKKLVFLYPQAANPKKLLGMSFQGLVLLDPVSSPDCLKKASVILELSTEAEEKKALAFLVAGECKDENQKILSSNGLQGTLAGGAGSLISSTYNRYICQIDPRSPEDEGWTKYQSTTKKESAPLSRTVAKVNGQLLIRKEAKNIGAFRDDWSKTHRQEIQLCQQDVTADDHLGSFWKALAAGDLPENTNSKAMLAEERERIKKQKQELREQKLKEKELKKLQEKAQKEAKSKEAKPKEKPKEAKEASKPAKEEPKKKEAAKAPVPEIKELKTVVQPPKNKDTKPAPTVTAGASSTAKDKDKETTAAKPTPAQAKPGALASTSKPAAPTPKATPTAPAKPATTAAAAKPGPSASSTSKIVAEPPAKPEASSSALGKRAPLPPISKPTVSAASTAATTPAALLNKKAAPVTVTAAVPAKSKGLQPVLPAKKPTLPAAKTK